MLELSRSGRSEDVLAPPSLLKPGVRTEDRGVNGAWRIPPCVTGLVAATGGYPGVRGIIT